MAKKSEISLTPSWSFICETVTTDARSYRMSFINQFDSVHYQNAPEKIESNKHTLVPLPLSMVFTWDWDTDDNLTVEKRGEISPSKATVRFVNPDGSVLVTEEDIPFVQTRTNESVFTGVIQVVNFPIMGWGGYTITVTPFGYDASVHIVKILIDRRDTPIPKRKTKKKKKRVARKKSARK